MTLQERMALFDKTDLYVVITKEYCGGRPSLEVLKGALDAGVGIVQFREKGLPAGELCRRASAFRSLTEEAGALLIINDRVDVALAVGADGVHLGQADLPLAAARQMAPELIIGASTHSRYEAIYAQEGGASYANIGPIFTTQTKEVAGGVLGPELISEVAREIMIPFTVMGGIKHGNVGEVLKRGVRHVAVVTAVTEADDVRGAAEELRKAIVEGIAAQSQ